MTRDRDCGRTWRTCSARPSAASTGGWPPALAAEGVTVEQWRILRALSDGHGHSMGDLAEAVLMPHPTLTKAVDRLVDDALVYRRQDAADRRRVAVYLSDRGRDLLARLDRRAAEHHPAVEAAYGAAAHRTAHARAGSPGSGLQAPDLSTRSGVQAPHAEATSMKMRPVSSPMRYPALPFSPSAMET